MLARNADVSSRWRRAGESEEHFALYRRYVGTRHAAGGMDQPTHEDYQRFLLSHWADTWFLELRLADDLIGAAVTDLVADAASAVYTYFAPELESRSLGTLAILKQIDYCRAQGLQHAFGVLLHQSMPAIEQMDFRLQGRGDVARRDRGAALAPLIQEAQREHGQHQRPIEGTHQIDQFRVAASKSSAW